MKLQNIIYPSTKNCTEENLYFRREGDSYYSYADDHIKLDEGALVYFDTYFNSFSANKWYKYTNIGRVKLKLKVKGKLRVTLVYKERQANEIFVRTITEFYHDTKGKIEEIDSCFDTELTQGMYAFNILAMEDGVEVYGGNYYTEATKEMKQKVRLAVVVCTFKREKYIYRNMEMLCEEFLDNPSSELNDGLEVFISDNAQSLDCSRLSNKKIHIFNNKNVGGAGGFTRGLIEAMKASKKKAFTHALLMDDDVVIQPESIFRTYNVLNFLKPEYEDAYVGGAMLRTDKQWFQTEAGAIWNGGALISHKYGLDLRKIEDCLYNEVEEKCDFNAWWYCTVPMKVVREDNLPLPIFIRGDDVEYGIRNMKYLILMNGICVWHEPFEFKYSSSLYYYILRNRLIDNAVRGIPYNEKALLREFVTMYRKETFLLRYKNARLLLQGVKDFLKGIDWLKEQDGEVLNKEIMSKSYKLQHVDELPIAFTYPAYDRTLNTVYTKKQLLLNKLTLNGFFSKANGTAILPVNNASVIHLYKAGNALNYDVSSGKGFVTQRDRKEMLALYKEYRKLKRNIKKNYKKVVAEYNSRKEEITNIDFWNKYLQLGK